MKQYEIKERNPNLCQSCYHFKNQFQITNPCANCLHANHLRSYYTRGEKQE